MSQNAKLGRAELIILILWSAYSQQLKFYHPSMCPTFRYSNSVYSLHSASIWIMVLWQRSSLWQLDNEVSSNGCKTTLKRNHLKTHPIYEEKGLVSILKVISVIVKDLRYTRKPNSQTIAYFQAGEILLQQIWKVPWNNEIKKARYLWGQLYWCLRKHCTGL